jgi:HSP20 family protein
VKKEVMKGLGDLLQMVAPGMNAVYGASIRVAPRSMPAVTRPRSVRRPLRRRETPSDDTREPVVDVFDESDLVVVVVQLPGVEEHAARWAVRDGVHLTVQADSADRKYLKELELPGIVDDQTIASVFANGVLELKLWKRT